MRLPPIPELNNLTVLEWSRKIVHYLKSVSRELETPGPKVIQLESLLRDSPATTNGLLMFDPEGKDVVVSIDGQWYPLLVGTTPVTTGIVHKRGNRSPHSGWPIP